MKPRKTLCAWAFGMWMTASAAMAAVGVENVTCVQQYPWNGKVDITCDITSDDPNADVWIHGVGFDQDTNVQMAMFSVTGDGVNAPVKPGRHHLVWDVSADYPDFRSTAFQVNIIAVTGRGLYMVVDLSEGPTAERYPVAYLNGIPEGGWTEEHKTTKLVLRLVPPGSFMMGSPTDELGHNWVSSGYYSWNIPSQCNIFETRHRVTLTKPFYMGVFEVTQKQWELVMGTTPSANKGAARPVEKVSYNAIRGSVYGAGWPTHNQVDATSFMGRLREKTDLLFDLPTEAQWEYACRAGTSTSLNSGKNITDLYSCPNMAEVGRYNSNRSDGKGGYDLHTTVGSYRPNAWGLYDMHGNVAEWCRDWIQADLGSAAVTDPKGRPYGSSMGDRVVRGGCWASNEGSYAKSCRSADRQLYYGRYGAGDYFIASKYYDYLGFRACCLSAE